MQQINGHIEEGRKEKMEEEAMVEQHQHDEKTQLPYDILFNVLMRLPTEYHYRFRCVAKVFSSILDDLFFRKTYCNRFPVRLFLSLRDSVGSKHFFSADLRNQDATKDHVMTGDNVIPLVHRFRIPSSKDPEFTQMINGLVCHRDEERLFLYKISTQEGMQLPLIPEHHSLSANLHFGFEPTNNVYKLLMSGNILPADPAGRFHILTVGESTWRRLPTPNFSPYTASKSICVRGVIYWALETRLSTFDLKNEVFVKVVLPREMASARGQFVLARYRNSLALIKPSTDTELTIWTLRGTTWDKYTVCVPSSKYKCTFIGNLPSGELLLVQWFGFVINMSTTVLVCDLISGSCRSFELGFPTSPWAAPFGDVISSCHEEENVSLKDLFGLKEDQVQSVGSL